MLFLFLNVHSIGQTRMSTVGPQGILLEIKRRGKEFAYLCRSPIRVVVENSDLWGLCSLIVHNIGGGPDTGRSLSLRENDMNYE